MHIFGGADQMDDDAASLREQLTECSMKLTEAGAALERLWNENKALKDDNSAKRRVIVRLLDTLSEIENVFTGCPPIIVEIIHKSLAEAQS